MNWFKENPALAILAAIALLGTGATSYVAMQGSTRYEQAVSDFNSQATTIRRLQAMQPYPDPANLQKVEESVKAYEDAVQGFQAELNKSEEPLVEITPQTFQDNLRQAVDEIQKRALEKKVALPEKFFFGFEDFQTQLPPLDQTKKLNREFVVIRKLVESIIPLGITSIDTLTRHDAAGSKTKLADPKAPPGKAIPFDSFTLGIKAPQNSFVAAFDKIPESEAFLVVRSMTIENSNPTPPSKAQTDLPASSSVDLLPDLNAGESEKLPMVFGNELVKAEILFEIPDFPEQPNPPAGQPAPVK
jgi:hypothetical protein